ncbi:hypothetical protein [Kitasatospora sp. NPDC088346]|uniref:hypothetical protein n=1 Tax=Kitasatospora sp. NPDC088346 TaxID=3364073 RepID=UPI00382576A2
MTHDPSVAPDPSAPATAPTPGGEDWNRQLADAFAVVLGRPLREFDADAVYAASVGGNLLYETGFRRDAAWVRPGALSGAEPVVWDCCLFDESGRTPVFDASRSLFEFLPPDGAGTAGTTLPQDFATALDAVRLGPGLVLGADLAPLVAQYGVDLADPSLAGTWTVYFPRLRSDGTLLDALRAALDTGDGPEDLVAFTPEPDEEWEEALAVVAHAGLRTHLGFFCTDGDEGLMPLGDATASGLTDLGCEQVAGWEDGYGQFDITVVRLSDHVAGLRRSLPR